jgi:surfeit locus 1 family protein
MTRHVILPAIVILGGLGVLIGLGTWQLDRKAWKEELIATLQSRLSAPPAHLPPRERWQRLDAAKDEFTRVEFPATFVPGEEALVYSSGSGLRPDATGPGYWVFSPARLTGGSLVVINRGFVPEGKQDGKTRPDGEPDGVVDIIGVMRWTEPRGTFTPNDEPAKNLWFARDPAAMAKAKNWGTIAPFYIDQEAPPAPGGLPRVGPLKANLPNNHLQYAVTWYGLAAVLVVASLLFWRSRRREARDEARSARSTR